MCVCVCVCVRAHLHVPAYPCMHLPSSICIDQAHGWRENGEVKSIPFPFDRERTDTSSPKGIVAVHVIIIILSIIFSSCNQCYNAKY